MTSIEDIFLFSGNLEELNSVGKGKYIIPNPNIVVGHDKERIATEYYRGSLNAANNNLLNQIRKCECHGVIHYTIIPFVEGGVYTVAGTSGPSGSTETRFIVHGILVKKVS